ncbi:MAG: GTP 3',8-cyclase MoaA [Clostridiales bacterium]|nr:GTP 3',8-cyclase MoaA [Clostridiales bacterium]
MIDNYGRNINYMRISVTELCNLRCRYCMPEEGIQKRGHEEMMTAEETIDAAKAAVSLGINKIRITGGEPLVKRGIVRLCREIAQINGIEELCMTTNGTLLRTYAKELKGAGVNRVNISLDTLNTEKYKDITRMGNLQEALDGIEASFEAGFDKVKINVVLMGGFNDDEISAFVALTMDRPLEVRFIELMPIGGGIDFDKARFVSCQEVLAKAPQLESLNMSDGVAGMYRLPGAKGRVGLIRPISCEFCHGCNKIRLTADGMLKPCLHSDDEISIKGSTQDEMVEIIRKAILDKPKMRNQLDADNPSRAGRDMNRIGG